MPVSQTGLPLLDTGVLALPTAGTAVVIPVPAGTITVTVRNVCSDGATVVFVGQADVTNAYNATTGSVPLAPDLNTARRCGESQTMSYSASAPIYGIATVNSATLAWQAWGPVA
jgi:hypothetical protein